MAMVLFDSPGFQVIHRQGKSGPLLLTFSSLGMFNAAGSLANGETFWAKPLAEKLDFAAIGFVAKQKDWFCGPQMEEACAIAMQMAERFHPVIAFGSSMGGYAVLRWGRQAGAGLAFALAPSVR